MLAGDGAAEAQREVEQLLRRLAGAGPLRLVAGVEQEGRMDVAVAGVSPGAGLEIVARADADASPRSPPRAGRAAPRCPLRARRRAPRLGDRDAVRHARSRAPARRACTASLPPSAPPARRQPRHLRVRAVDLGDTMNPCPRTAREGARRRPGSRPRRGTRARPGRLRRPAPAARPRSRSRRRGRRRRAPAGAPARARSEPRCGDDPERPLRADQQRAEVVARDVLALAPPTRTSSPGATTASRPVTQAPVTRT